MDLRRTSIALSINRRTHSLNLQKALEKSRLPEGLDFGLLVTEEMQQLEHSTPYAELHVGFVDCIVQMRAEHVLEADGQRQSSAGEGTVVISTS